MKLTHPILNKFTLHQNSKNNMKPQYSETLDFATFKSKLESVGAQCQKLDIIYNQSDSRVWTAIVNPQKEALMVTGHINRLVPSDAFFMGNKSFDILSSTQTITNIHPEEIHENITDLLEETETITPQEVE